MVLDAALLDLAASSVAESSGEAGAVGALDQDVVAMYTDLVGKRVAAQASAAAAIAAASAPGARAAPPASQPAVGDKRKLPGAATAAAGPSAALAHLHSVAGGRRRGGGGAGAKRARLEAPSLQQLLLSMHKSARSGAAAGSGGRTAGAAVGTLPHAAQHEPTTAHIGPAARSDAVVVYPLSRMDGRASLLADLQPAFIVVYDPDPSEAAGG
jgi:hypothetical protein